MCSSVVPLEVTSWKEEPRWFETRLGNKLGENAASALRCYQSTGCFAEPRTYGANLIYCALRSQSSFGLSASAAFPIRSSAELDLTVEIITATFHRQQAKLFSPRLLRQVAARVADADSFESQPHQRLRVAADAGAVGHLEHMNNFTLAFLHVSSMAQLWSQPPPPCLAPAFGVGFQFESSEAPWYS